MSELKEETQHETDAPAVQQQEAPAPETSAQPASARQDKENIPEAEGVKEEPNEEAREPE
jgi:hypothetical protein